MQLQARDRHPCVVSRSAFPSVIMLVTMFVSGCGPTQPFKPATAPPEVPATLRIVATGLVRHEVIPDFVTSYGVVLTDPDHRIHEGFFEDPRTGPTPPGTTVLGDVPKQVRPGHYQIRFSMERVSDESSFVPVAGGTPLMTNSELLTSCDAAFDAKPGVDLIITARFTLEVPDGGAPEGTCRVEIS
jgi:hypothetical protein